MTGKTNPRFRRIAAAALLCAGLTACAGGGTDAGASAKYTAIAADGNGTVSIPSAGVTREARFFNFDADGVTVQLVALRDAGGGTHIAFNTCQSCSPSPKAYYTQSGEVLQCTNCGFTFAPEEVGVAHGGCNPWPIDGAEIGPEEITVPAASLEAMKAVFASWEGPTK